MQKKEKVVFWDLETLPVPEEIYKRIPSLGAWPGRTLKAQLQTVMCFAYKINDEPTKCINVWDLSDDIHDDSALIAQAYDILYDADEMVTHNGQSFDLKHLNTGLIRWGMPPLPKIQHVDTKLVAKRGLSLYSNSLDDVAKFLGVGQKIHWNDKWAAWVDFAMKRDDKKLRELMTRYAKVDVDVLSAVYKKLRPFMTTNVNRNQFSDRPVCPACGSSHIQKNGFRRTKTAAFQRYLCQDCGTSSFSNEKTQKIRGF